MHGIFLSYSFRNEQDPLVRAVRAIIQCAGFRVIDGKVLDGFRVGPEVRDRIAACSGMVCVLTPEAMQSGWVTAEFFQAVGQDQPRIIVLCEQGIQLPNPFQGVAVDRYGTGTELPAIEMVAARLGMWKQSIGSTVRAVLLPADVGQRAYEHNARCEYRCEEVTSFQESSWRDARLKPIDAGIHAILPEVPDGQSVQVKVTFNNGQFWRSEFIPQHLRLELKQ